uniref:Uncharacterized protein n=1 Tax=Zea mays TaxID=4577 RepID=C0HE37_MAIZE|nr:unknown [Zea mays]
MGTKRMSTEKKKKHGILLCYKISTPCSLSTVRCDQKSCCRINKLYYNLLTGIITLQLFTLDGAIVSCEVHI